MRKGISQEGLKLLACVTMLCDHVGHVLVYPLAARSAQMAEVYLMLRIIGRLAFPIYCFLLTEGFCHTRNRGRYALRLGVGVLLAELPYDLMISGQFSWHSQSVMVTLLLGFGTLWVMEKCTGPGWKVLAAVPFALLAELLCCDYGWIGIILIMLFDLSRSYPRKNIIRCGGMLILFHQSAGWSLWFGNISVPVQAFGVLSMLFIASYDGRKQTQSKAAQLAFYLFYPAHMLVLYLISRWLAPGILM